MADDGQRVEIGRARQRAGLLLAHRDRSPAEIEQALARSFSAEVAVLVATELAADGLIDERRFADAHAAHRLDHGWGPRRIVYDLERAGVSAAVIASVLQDLDREAVAAGAQRAARGQVGPAAWRRQVARGFDLDAASG